MKYTVVTTPLADNQLADIWLNAPNRQHVSDAFRQIETLLKQDAHDVGRAHPDGWRVLTRPPLAILSVFFRP